MKVVSNADPLIALSKLGQLGLLLKLYDEIHIRHTVYEEVAVSGLRLGAAEAQTVNFLVQQGRLQVTTVSAPSPLPNWAQSIHSGELEVIILAQQQSPDWVLIDDAQARRVARRVGLPLKGTVGVLLEAFRFGSLSLQEFELLMEDIKARPELWISERLCDQALAQARQEARSGSP